MLAGFPAEAYGLPADGHDARAFRLMLTALPADAHDALALPADARGLCQLMLMMRGLCRFMLADFAS